MPTNRLAPAATLSVLSTTSTFNNTAESTATSNNTTAVHHDGYYLQDEHIRLQAGNTVFQTHAYLFATESEEASNLADEVWLNYAELMQLKVSLPTTWNGSAMCCTPGSSLIFPCASVPADRCHPGTLNLLS
jgi:hypothetical protein